MSTTIRDDVDRITEDADSDFGGPHSYEWLRDVIIACLNPADDDAAEESVLTDALVQAAEFIERQPCKCVDPDGDACPRCAALGRHADRTVTR